MIMHNITALPARILGRSCPMLDIEHPFLYNPVTIIQMLEANGFEVQKEFSVYNRYPISYWMQLLPLPSGFKRSMLDFFQKTPAGNIPVTLGLGNMGIIARKKE